LRCAKGCEHLLGEIAKGEIAKRFGAALAELRDRLRIGKQRPGDGNAIDVAMIETTK
jgi:hypothetical protein